MISRRFAMLVVLGILASGPTWGADPSAVPAGEALATIRVKPGFRVELVAAEPLVVSPVAIDFGADGKLWVCEMRDYPAGIDGSGKPGGVIKTLEDRDGDGRYETATEFLTGLPFPTGVMAWRKGALICAAPEILHAEDTDGDGVADVRKVLFRGFATENYQARVNGLSYGLDNWVYGANGLIGGTIHGTATGREVNIGGRDFRIRPDTGAMEPASGLTQQGRVHDDWGEQFGGNNSVLIQHYPLPDHYARRNPRVAVPGPAVHVPRDPESSRVYPASRTVERFNSPQSANRVTSACSPLIYRDTLLGPEYAGNAFTCEPVHNLIHREVLTPDGITFAGHRAADERESEFLASTDNWFRPVQVRTGPDGALWVVDMYRSVIEHPRWISPELLATLDVRAGADRGRIYRVYHESSPPRAVPVLDRLSTPDLARALDSPNGTIRDNVQRVLVHRADPAAIPVLSHLAARSERPEVRAQALCTLEGLGALKPWQHLNKALRDPHPGVRRQAVRLAEPWMDRALETRFVESMTDDPDIKVRFQVALSLGEGQIPNPGTALGRLAVREPGDPWLRAAVLSSAVKHPAPILSALIAAGPELHDRGAWFAPLAATLAALDDPKALAQAIAKLPRREMSDPRQLALMADLFERADASTFTGPTVFTVFDAVAAARDLARDPRARPADRAVAVRLLGRDPIGRDGDVALLGELLGPKNPAEVQRAAVLGLARLGGDRADAGLFKGWPGLGPMPRASALDAWLARPERASAMLAAIERGAIAPAEIDATHRQRLLRFDDAAIRDRAARAFAKARPRAEVIEAYRPLATRPGDPERGKAIFGKTCAVCHKLGGVGHEVGPDLAALTDTSPESLLIAILDPDRDVDARYAGYTAALKDGRVVTGLIAAETAVAITLKRQEGQHDVILRDDLDELRTSGQSLMPEGLENDVKPAEMADLIAYLGAGPGRPRVVAGNHPEVVAQAPDGTIRLDAASAEIRGPTLTFEPEFANLGDWQAVDDRASWTFRVDRPSTFTLAMDWACAHESAGNGFEVRVGDRMIRGTVAETGSDWSRYRSIFVGELILPTGTHRLEFRPAAIPRGALLDLRSLVLTPRAVSTPRNPSP